MTDEEAFRVADLENRSRKDLSDYERATDYARAIDRYYDGSQQRMVDRLQVTKSWLSCYLELARLPPEVLSCFESPHVVGISHAATLAPRLSHPKDRSRMLAVAEGLAAERSERASQGLPAWTPAQTVSRLIAAEAGPGRRLTHSRKDFLDDQGRLLVTVEPKGRRGIAFTVPQDRIPDGKAVLKAISLHLDELRRHR